MYSLNLSIHLWPITPMVIMGFSEFGTCPKTVCDGFFTHRKLVLRNKSSGTGALNALREPVLHGKTNQCGVAVRVGQFLLTNVTSSVDHWLHRHVLTLQISWVFPYNFIGNFTLMHISFSKKMQ